MKKIFAATLALVLAFLGAGAKALEFECPKVLLEQKDAATIVRAYLLPELQEDRFATLIFAGELNISNGDPYVRNFGERGIFGKLVTGETARQQFALYEKARDEVSRLLFGPWIRKGMTEFSFSASYAATRALDLWTGKMEKSKVKWDYIIRIRHATEYYGKIRYAFLGLQQVAEGADTITFRATIVAK